MQILSDALLVSLCEPVPEMLVLKLASRAYIKDRRAQNLHKVWLIIFQGSEQKDTVSRLTR